MKKLVIFGCGSVGRLAYQIANDIASADKSERWDIIGFLDDDSDKHGTELLGLPVLSNISWLKDNSNVFVIPAVGSPSATAKTAKGLKKINHSRIATLIHPSAWIPERVKVGKGTIIYPGVHVDPDVTIGNYVNINKSCTIGHDTVIEDFVTIAPGVNVGGNVNIGEGCDLGINCSTIQDLSIGEWSVIGAGAAVVKNLPSNIVAIGIPAKVIREKSQGWHKN